MRAKRSGSGRSKAVILAGSTWIILMAGVAPWAWAQPKPAPSLEQVFREQPYRGEPAKQPEFSYSGRYLAYLWSPYGEPGSDLHVVDTRSGKTLRLTSPALMQAFDAPEDLARFDKKLLQKRSEQAERQAREEAQAAYLRGVAVDLNQWEDAALAKLKIELADKKTREDAQKAADKAEAEAEKRAADVLAARRAGKPVPAAAPEAPASAASAAAKPSEKDKELWELRDELKKKLAKDKLKPEDQYPGVTQLVWANQRDELILQYRGSLLRWQAGQEKLQALLSTQRQLRIVAYTPDDQGFVFMDEKRVLRARFASAAVQVLNRELIHPDDEDKKYRIDETVISEDGRWMSLLARAPLTAPDGKSPPPKPGRQVEIMNYGERFASAKKVDREVSDDKRMERPLALYIRKVPGLDSAPTKQPQPVFTHKGGDGWFEISPVAWARDGSHYAFATWEREKELLRVYLGGPDENAKPELVLERRGDVHHELVSVLKPVFTPDGKRLVLVLAENGWRQPHAYELAGKQWQPLLQKGEFEAHQVLGFTPDSQQMFVQSNKDDLAAMNLYRVELKSGAMQALGQASDYHRGGVVSHDGQWLAAMAGHWAQRPELKLLRGQGKPAEPRVLTQSHDPAWAEVDVLRPERFSYPNRHGDSIPAYVFKPVGWQASDRRPAVVYTYGGPLNDRHSVETDSFQPTGYLFAMYMAAKHGYVMVTVDPRGHSNYGKRFADANFEQPGVAQSEDLEDLVAYMKAKLGVDGARLGLNGWSFGGFQTQQTLYTKPDLFAAGIAGAGPTEWENYNSWYSGRTIGKVDRTKPVLRKYSLLPLARNLKKPLLLVHGMQDPNVLYQDTVNVYRALLESGKEGLVDLFLDPDGEHGMGGAVKAVGWHRKYEAFWLQHLGKVQQAGFMPSPSAADYARIPRSALPALLRAAPKAELHIHIEGSLEPELIFRLAQRNGLSLPYASVDALRAAYAFSDLQSFLDIYYAGASVLLQERDFFDMAWAYLERAAADGVVHTEIFFDPQTHTARGVPMGTVIQGLRRACRRAEAELGLSASLILCFLRHLSEADALATLEAALPWRADFIGVGLDSSELGHPPEKFARVFARARELGLQLVAHAGEEGPPAYVWSALDVLTVQRIDHGVRSLEDAALVARLAAERMPLTVCPLSNVKLCVFKQLAEHNLPALLDAGLCALVNSDDPAYFGGYLNDNLLQCFEALPQLHGGHAWQLLSNSFEASFVAPEQKRRWQAALDAQFQAALIKP